MRPEIPSNHSFRGYLVTCREFITIHPDGLSGGTRTPDLLLRRQLLYPVELRTASPGVYRARQRDSSKALLTTLTELKAIAAPATMGFKPPKAARGIPKKL